MAIENNGPDAAYPGPAEKAPGTAEQQGSGTDQASSEPKQGADQSKSGDKPEDWTPPEGNPGSDQDAQTGRNNGGAGKGTDSLIDAE